MLDPLATAATEAPVSEATEAGSAERGDPAALLATWRAAVSEDLADAEAAVPPLERAVASAAEALAQALAAQVAVQALLRPLEDRLSRRPNERLAPFLAARRSESEERLAKTKAAHSRANDDLASARMRVELLRRAAAQLETMRP